jgi:predicted kinase
MEAVIFTGVQAVGKSSFYQERFFRTHVRINLDMLKTRHRERLLLAACLEARQPLVVDNTNPTIRERAPYIAAARAAGFAVRGFYFQSKVEDCLARNASRAAGQRVPDKAILGTYRRLEVPSFEEGFDRLLYVRLGEGGQFIVEDWRDEV